MTDFQVVLTVVVFGIAIYLLGQFLIDAYFRRKEKFVDRLNNKMRGQSDGS